MSNNIYNNISLFLGTALSVALHSAVIFLIYAYIQRNEDKVIYVQAELWSALPPESKDSSSVPNELSREIENPLIRNTPKNSNTLMDEGKKSDAPDDIGLAKEKERKEKLAKEKAEKERIIAQQRNEEVKRLKNALAGMNLNEVPRGGNNDKTTAGVEGGSEDGKRVGELADYNEQISSKIRRKIIFDYKKVTGNPKVVFTVTSINGSLKKIILQESSGNLKWDSAVRDAIQRSVPLPEPTDAYYAARAKKDGLTLTFRPRDRN